MSKPEIQEISKIIMLTPETALQKIKQLSSEQQKQVFQLIETLEKQREETEDFFAIAGIWENRAL